MAHSISTKKLRPKKYQPSSGLGIQNLDIQNEYKGKWLFKIFIGVFQEIMRKKYLKKQNKSNTRNL